jgi:predicted dehydrogenase
MSKNYDLKSTVAASIPAPELTYQPPAPKGRAPKIGLIGCGGITEHHLKAYRAAGWEVAAFFDRNPEAAEGRRKEFYPEARVCATVEEMFADPEIAVVDIATHPIVRAELIEQAISAGKHILSQKPFAVDLESGERLVKLAADAGVKIAVNQNGRWAPYFSYMRHAVNAGLIGEVGSVHMVLNWDHTWTAGTPFEEIHHLMLYDFGIHWIDAARSFFDCRLARESKGDGASIGQSSRSHDRAYAASVSATLARFPDQPIKPPMLANVAVSFPNGMATIAFNGCSRFGARETCTITGTKGTIHAVGGICDIGSVEIHTADGIATAQLDGSWFPDGFRGCMGELLCAIEENREPGNSAANNLKSLALVLAAMKSADDGVPVAV